MRSNTKRLPRGAKLPRSVTIHGTRYQVVKVRGLKDAEGNPAYGCCEPDCTTIHIDSACPQERARTVLIHEVAHGAVEETGFGHLLRIAVKDESVCDHIEEDLIRRVIPAFLASVDEIRQAMPNGKNRK